MRRTQLRRSTKHLVSRIPLRRFTPIRQKSDHNKSEIPDKFRLAVVLRSGGLCEGRVEAAGCTSFGEHMHHVLLRSRGGGHEPSNLAHLCHLCHRWTHDHPAEATELGLMRSAWMS